MEFLQLILLSLIQGITEFLPVSSSAHLILVPVLTNWDDQGLLFDVAAHLGTLFAVMIYYRSDLSQMVRGVLVDYKNKKVSNSSSLMFAIIIATVPLGLFGLLFKSDIETYLRSPLIIATATILFGLLLGFSDRKRVGSAKDDSSRITLKAALIIGFAQVLALIPGTSRSGITITAALLLGFNRQVAARFSFLLSIPAILMPCSYYALKIIQAPDIDFNVVSLLTVIVFSFLSAYGCIALFVKALDKIGMMPFVIYRLILGVVLLIIFL